MHKKIFLSALISAIVSIFFFNAGAYIYSMPQVRETLILATTVQPERFTELYFEDHLNLPKTITKDGDYTFRFTIHNLEHEDMEYTYEFYIQYMGKKEILNTQKVRLNHDEYRTILQSLRLIEPVDKARIVINLVEKNQEIAFWIRKPGIE